MERQAMKGKDLNLGLQLIATLLLLCLCYTCEVAEGKSQQTTKKTYIIHMDMSKMAATYEDHLQWYDSSLKSVSESADMLYTYSSIIHGFSTRLTQEEAELLGKQSGILSVLPETIYKLHTTHSPEFLGLGSSDSVVPASASSSEVIVGVLDTGVWPEIKSFDDTGLGPVPSTWKGTCEAGKNFNSSSCNRKLIGAQYFSKGYEAAFGPIDETMESKSPRDDDGHGTHTATTAAGSAVSGASLFGYAFGTARGMAPQARVAAYKVCWLGGCFSSDILAGMEKAVADGVNVISMSIGGGISDYNRDTVAIGAFRAVAQGILVSCSAGNSGPSPGSLTNVAPWITTVGAGTLDRDFPAYVSLGNGKNYSGISLYSGKPLSDSLVPLVYAGNVSNSTKRQPLHDRNSGSNSRVQKGLVVKDSGALGMILANTELYGEELVADAHVLPTSTVGQRAADAIKNYAFTDPKPTATIASGGTKLGVEPSPVLAAFSSRGPNLVTPEVLKPDLIAPGVNILAGWTGAAGPSGLTRDTRHRTSRAHQGCSPGLERGSHQVRSHDHSLRDIQERGKHIRVATGQPSTPFDFGAGHVNPMAALDPGLVYEPLSTITSASFPTLNKSRTRTSLATRARNTVLGDLNYPSFSVPLETASGKGGGAGVTSTVKYTRTLTNVGAPATYKLSMTSKTQSVKISVEPGVPELC
uniref:Inhibitor I9 domain-containing protein n=1 Tax=Salix viminalis TaxID=40686 RepID=A0A6N2MKM6_SALVM